MNISIPGLSTLYAIFKRDIDVKNDRLEYRRELAKELYDNCREWSKLLLEYFDQALAKWMEEGKGAAMHKILELEDDFHQLNYNSLKEDSPIIRHLQKDRRFKGFSDSCCEFYQSALGVKRIVYGDIKNKQGEYISLNDVEIDEMVSLWKDEVRGILNEITYKWMEIQTIEKK